MSEPITVEQIRERDLRNDDIHDGCPAHLTEDTPTRVRRTRRCARR